MFWYLVSKAEGLSKFVHRAQGHTAVAILVAVGLAFVISWFGGVQAPRTPEIDGRTAGMSSSIADSSAPTPTVPLSGASRQQAAGTLANEPTPAPAAPGPIIPSFDIVRVEPNGDSVIAGRAAPGAIIELWRNGEPHLRALADESGAFALVPPPLPPGSHEIVLQSVAPDGTRARSRDSVTVVVADNKTTPPLVALTSPDKPTMVLSNPDRSGTMPVPQTTTASAPEQARSSGVAESATRPGTPPVGPRTEVRIAAIDAEDGGRLFVSGQAPPGATLRLYLNETLIAPGTVGADGKLAFTINRGVKPGSYRIRLDDVDPVSGEVKSRAEVSYKMPVQIAAEPPRSVIATRPGAGFPTQLGPKQFSERASDDGTVLIPQINTAIVARGDNLWRISHHTYGDGLRYTIIYGGNQDQIRDPNLIYPGQAFVLPPGNSQNPRDRRMPPADEALPKVIAACRERMSAQAQPLGATRVEAVTAGTLVRLPNGGTEVPLEVKITYERENQVQVRQARITCRLNDQGGVIELL
jgi:nucleoid-associated protein YgaU